MSQEHWVMVDKKDCQRNDVDRMALPTLDLHGYAVEPAIKRLVEFLEKHCRQHNESKSSNSVTGDRVISSHSSSFLESSMIKVVTGMGSHSGNSGGPVLKNYVNNFLVRHSFQFTYHTKGGYFIIPTIHNTGTLKYRSKSCEFDSKIVTIPRTSSDCPLQSPRADNFSNKKAFDVDEMPTLQEVVCDETELKFAIDESIQEFRLQQKELNNEQKIYEHVLEMSRVEVEKEVEKEELLLFHAIQESAELSEREGSEFEASLEEAIAVSLEASERSSYNNDDDDDLLMQLAMRESEALIDASKRDDEEAFQRILKELSLHE